MTPEILNFLTNNRVGVLCVTLTDGSPHAATVHYSHHDNPVEFYISTSSLSKKCEAIKDGGTVAASFVVGFDESEMVTFQADGEVHRVKDAAELNRIHATHYAKHPFAERFKSDPNTAILKFIPKWWRYTDYSGSQPRILTD